MMDNLHLVTGFLGREHITAADQGAFNAALIGTGQFVLEKGKVFEAQVISNNLIRVLDGELMMQGRFVRLAPNDYADLAIENGEKGLKRNDLIAVRYAKDTLSGIESVNLVVIKGEAVADNPVDPAITEGDITKGAAVQHEFPLWRIPLDGLNVGEPVSLFGEPFMDSMRTLPGIRKSVETIHSEVDEQLARYDEQMAEKIAKIESYTKEETLSNETKAAFGFGADAVPNDAFAKLSGLYLHNWRRRVNGKVLVEQTGFDNKLIAINSPSGWASYTFNYSDAVSFSSDGTITLNEPVSSVSITAYTEYEKANALKGKYYFERATSGTRVWYVPADADDATYSASDNSYRVIIERHAYIATDHIGDWEFLSSTNRNTYPDSVIQDGYEYQYLGIPFDNVVTAPKIATGSYVGTGTAGASNPNSLTFEFAPKLVVIKRIGDGTLPTLLLGGDDTARSISHTFGGGELTVSTEGNSISWYHSGNTWTATSASGGNPDPYYQLNTAEKDYTYVALG